jgi:hypothetical protein
MIRTTLFASTFLLAIGSAALAQPGGEGNNTNCNGQGNPNSPCVPGAGNGGQGGNASSRAAARASSRAAARANATGGRARSSATGGRGGSASASVTNNITGGGGGGGYDRRVPDVSAPAIWSNNPCVVAMSGGVAVAGFGMSLGGGIEDRDCTRRANAQHLVSMGQHAAAKEVLCQSTEVREAFARVGQPCAQDVAQPAPMVSTTYREVIGGGQPVRPNRPAYCETLRLRGMVTDECL